ncbi:MAG: CaiB/BaiF CoA transferase family protein [Burkholderiaceae bacterium]
MSNAGADNAAADEATGLPLSGIRVIEFSHMVMGPTCGMILADLGAEVIKIEPPEGDRTRNLPGLGIGFFRSFNRNKKSVVLDVDRPEGHAAAIELIAASDVVIENFRPGRMASLALDHASLHDRFPALIYVSHKGFLPGPYEHRTALDEVVQMMGGLAYMTGPPGRPLRAGTSVNDIMGGLFGALGVLAALQERQRTGRGQEVQSALFENCVFLNAQHMQQFAMTGEPPPPMPARVSSWGVYDIFTLANDEQLFVAAVSDRQWQLLCKVLDAPELAADPALATNSLRVAARATMLPRLRALLVQHDIATLESQLEAAALPYARIVRPDELFDDPHLRESGGLAAMQSEDGTMTEIPLLPLLLGGRRLKVRRPLPKVGEHSEEVFRALRAASRET